MYRLTKEFLPASSQWNNRDHFKTLKSLHFVSLPSWAGVMELVLVINRVILWVILPLESATGARRVSMQTLKRTSSSHVGAHPGLAVGWCQFTLAAFSRWRLGRHNACLDSQKMQCVQFCAAVIRQKWLNFKYISKNKLPISSHHSWMIWKHTITQPLFWCLLQFIGSWNISIWMQSTCEM